MVINHPIEKIVKEQEKSVMKNNKERFINIQLFADEPTGATTPEISTQDGGVNYEQEYKRLQLELEKQKKLKDEYAKESAGYKKK